MLGINATEYQRMFLTDDPVNCPITGYGVAQNASMELKNSTLNDLVVIESKQGQVIVDQLGLFNSLSANETQVSFVIGAKTIGTTGFLDVVINFNQVANAAPNLLFFNTSN